MKSNKARRVLAILLCTASLLMLYAAAVSAQKVSGLLVAGDSISSGRGLDDRAGKRYGSLLAAKLGLSGGKNINVAEDDMTSTDLLEKLPGYEAGIKAADLMVISVGTYDIMSIILPALDPAGGGIDYPKLLEMVRDADYVRRVEEAIDQYALVNAMTKYYLNLEKIVTLIKQANPGIRIVLLSLYNPFAGSEQLSTLKAKFDLYIKIMNDNLRQVAETYGCRVLDLAAAFESKTGQLTDITSLDISPNAAGHTLIADLLFELISTLPDPPETEPPQTNVTSESQPTDTTPPPEETTTSDPLDLIKTPPESRLWIYILVAVCAGGTGIIIGAISVRSKKE
ncbi:MAG: SGNH/GDSL hydrolase family protein [Eubacteriales bacterium]|jgi:lysophospholipase L1-like esterase